MWTIKWKKDFDILDNKIGCQVLETLIQKLTDFCIFFLDVGFNKKTLRHVEKYIKQKKSKEKKGKSEINKDVLFLPSRGFKIF